MNDHLLRTYGRVLLGLLTVEYILGMISNLFLQFPQSDAPRVFWEYAWSQWPTAAHIVIAILLLIVATSLLIRAIRTHSHPWSIAGWIGLLGILIAGVDGATFVSSQANSFSFLMSLGFLLAFLSYGWGLYTTK